MKKPTKREVRRRLRLLCNVPHGCAWSLQYNQLKAAKKFASDNDLEFPKESQQQLTKVSQFLFIEALNYKLGIGVFK